MKKELSGRIALVTGSGRGIGRATALALAAQGADLVVNYHNSDGPADEVCHLASENGGGGRTRVYKADVSNEEEVIHMVEEVRAKWGPITILVNNAGITRDRSFLKTTRLMWDEVLGVNLNGAFNTTHAVLPGMIEAGWGRIINVASVVGLTGNFGQANYATTKGGLI